MSEGEYFDREPIVEEQPPTSGASTSAAFGNTDEDCFRNAAERLREFNNSILDEGDAEQSNSNGGGDSRSGSNESLGSNSLQSSFTVDDVEGQQINNCGGDGSFQEGTFTAVVKYWYSESVVEKQAALSSLVKALQQIETDSSSVQVIFNIIKNALNLTMVRKTCQAAVLILLDQGILSLEDLESKVVPVILQLAKYDTHEDVRVEAVSLLCKLIAPLGRDRTVRLILHTFTELCQDSLFHVRKMCAAQLGDLGRVLGPQLTEKILVPHLIALSQDSIWGVRKACAECFTEISHNCSMQIRRHHLAPVFIVLLADNSRWVQSAAFQDLGPFISTFADANRTGLKWVEGRLMYEDPSCKDYGGSGDDVFEYGEAREDVTNLHHGEGHLEKGDGPEYDIQDLLPPSSKCPVFAPHSSPKFGGTEAEEYMEIDDLFESLVFVNSSMKTAQASSNQSATASFKDDQSDPARLDADGCSWSAAASIRELSLEESNIKVSSDQMKAKERLELKLTSDETETNNSNSTLKSSIEAEEYSSFLYWQASLDAAKQALPEAQAIDIPKPPSEPEVEKEDSGLELFGTSPEPALKSFMDRRFSYNRSPTLPPIVETPVLEKKEEPLPPAAVTPSLEPLEPHKTTSAELTASAVVEIASEMTACPSQGTEKEPCSLSVVDLKESMLGSLSWMSLESSTNISVASLARSGGAKIESVSLDNVYRSTEKLMCESRSSSSVSVPAGDNSEDERAPSEFQYQDIIPQPLLDQFLSMVEPSRTQVETDISRHCAFNLPAVAYTIGRQNWPCLKQLYVQLANDMQWKVRRTLAFSIHELAAILGAEITLNDLLPVFVSFLKDLDEVRIGVLKHLYDFLMVLKPEHRRELLSNIPDFLSPDNPRNWRFRHLLAEQLTPLCDLYSIEDINEYFSPIALTLATERIAEIRKVAYTLLASILRHFYTSEMKRSSGVSVGPVTDDGDSPCLSVSSGCEEPAKVVKSECPPPPPRTEITDRFIVDIVKSFARSEQFWRRRQTYVYLCREVIAQNSVSESKFAELLLPNLLALANDRVPNVRIALANLLTRSIHYFRSDENGKIIGKAMENFFKDSAREVKDLAEHYWNGTRSGEQIICAGGSMSTSDLSQDSS